MKGLRDRTLQKLAFLYYLKDPNRTPEENWQLAEKLLKKLEKRYLNKKIF